MLVIGRQESEETVITVAPSTEPTVIVHRQLSIRGDRSRHGWQASANVTINRREVEDAIRAEKRTAELAASEKLLKTFIG